MKRDSSKDPGLRMRLLGELALARDGRALPLPPSKKTRALLAYLAATGKPQLREQLCTLLWDGPDDPRAQLRWSLYKLRPLLDETKRLRLRADREHIALDLSDVEVDIHAAAAARDPGKLTTPDLLVLAGRFGGSFLDGLELPGCYRFHAWCVAERERFHAARVAVVSTLIERLTSAPEQALPHARVLLSLDPLAESSHITVVRLLDELGRTHEALEQYERWRRLVERELGGKPSRDMEAIRMAIGKGRSLPRAEAAPASAMMPTVVESGPPLLGREREMAMLVGHVEGRMRGAAGRACEVVLLLGDAGIGKSRLLEELATHVRRAGGHVLAGRAFEAELIRPYGAWIDALRESDAGAAREFQATSAPDQDGERAGKDDRNRMFERVVATLRALARERAPLLVLLDDLQWLDEAGAALLHYVARALSEEPVLFACSARGGELSDNPAALRLVRALARDHRLCQIELGPLDAGAVAALVAAFAPSVDIGAVVAGCEGNPLFALELARAHARGEADAAQTLRMLIGERLERLDERSAALLPFAAAMGRSFDPHILARVLDLQAAPLLAALGDLERRGVLRAGAAGLYDFSHDLIRQAAYHQVSEPRRRLVHLQLARALAALSDPNGEWSGDLAHHAALGGDHDTAAHAYLAAAQRCMRLFAWSEAGELCRRGVEELPYLDRATRLHLHVELLGVEVLGTVSRERAREIDRDLLLALADAEAAGAHKDIARAHYLRSVAQFRTEDHGGAIETMWRAVRAGEVADAVTEARSKAEAGRCLVLLERDIGTAKELLEGARGLLSGDEDDLTLSWGLGLLARYLGDPAGASRRLHQATALSRQIDSHWEEAECLRALTLLALEQGDFGAARDLCPRQLDLASRVGEGADRSIAEALDSLACLLSGESSAHAAFAVALDHVRTADAKAMLATLLNLAAEHTFVRGETERARDFATEALAAARLVGRTSQAAVACALLARLAMRTPAQSAATALLEPWRAMLCDPFALSSRARAAVERALRESVPPAGSKNKVATKSARSSSIQGR